MNKTSHDDLDLALRAQSEGRVNEWVQEFLKGKGANSKLAKTLLDYEEFSVGPIDYPLEKVVNIIGPTKTYKFYEDEDLLNTRVDEMIKSIKAGWRPAPLILTNIWEDHLELADGGHRQRALLKSGYTAYPTIIYFRDIDSKEDFLKQNENEENIL